VTCLRERGRVAVHPSAMGRFTCVRCCQGYYDKRFFWESDKEEESTTETSGTLDEGPLCRSASKISAGGCPASHGGESSEDDISTAASATEGNPEDEGLISPRMQSPRSDGNSTIDLTGSRVYADVIRASGTAANVTGAITHSGLLGPISMVGGLVGAAGGAAQLKQGLDTGDPHLLTKGGVTTGVGGSCTVMGMLACVEPVLFVTALTVGVVGLGVATAVDATMSGLCPTCREEASERDDKRVGTSDGSVSAQTNVGADEQHADASSGSAPSRDEIIGDASDGSVLAHSLVRADQERMNVSSGSAPSSSRDFLTWTTAA